MATHSSILAWEIPWTEEPGKSHEQRRQVTVHRVAELDTHVNLAINYTSRQVSR